MKCIDVRIFNETVLTLLSNWTQKKILKVRIEKIFINRFGIKSESEKNLHINDLPYYFLLV